MTYASLAWEFAAETYLMELQSLKNKFFAQLLTTQGAHLVASCMRFSKRVCVQDFFYEIIQAVTASRTTVWK
jgi:hypothetical protein